MQVSFPGMTKSRFRALLVCILLLGGSFTEKGFAQGQLSRIRNIVHADAKRDRANNEEGSERSKKPRSRKKEQARKPTRKHHRDHNRRNRGWQPQFTGFLSSGTSIVETCHHPTVVHVYSPPTVCEPLPSPVIFDPLQGSLPPVLATPIIDAPVPPGYEVVSEPEAVFLDPVPDQNAFVAGLEDCQFGADWFADWAFRGRAIYGGGIDNLTTAGLSMLAQKPGGIGLDASVKTWRESSHAFREHLWLGDANLLYEFANHRDIRGRLGLGMNWINDSWGGDVGFNMTAEVEMRLTDRWLFLGQADIGTLGSSDFLHTELSLARRFNGTELVVGFDYYDIGGVDLQGVFGGLQFRF